MRGEDYRKSCKNTCVAETPPHAWGRPAFMEFAPKALGNTPTCVGKTQLWPRASAGSEKHPHMRGEDCLLLISDKCVPETPPHAWGRRIHLRNFKVPSRNTPTCVGKTHRPRKNNERPWKHPHMRGEDDARFKDSYAAEETPPHAWGRHGYTPDIKTTEEKHPHMRGEDRGKKPAGDYLTETPPHAWGRPILYRN